MRYMVNLALTSEPFASGLVPQGMRKILLPAVLTAAASMMLSVSPAQASTFPKSAPARTEITEPTPLGNLIQGGPVSFPESLIRLLPIGQEI
ncbi:hypothetical protein [Streptomyces sp. NPDC047706]|uniref:hypothetical protein n=1 Tax=Streptomyces sp. NPDC047706 TaxID=3365486 RepID=UPI0037180DA9